MNKHLICQACNKKIRWYHAKKLFMLYGWLHLDPYCVQLAIERDRRN